MAITWSFQADLGRDTSYGAPNADITSRVIAWSLRWGMDESYQEFAPPARVQLTLRNDDAELLPDKLGPELVANGGFAAWTADNPDNWTVTGESGADPQVNEVGAGESNGGTGTGKCNIFTSSATVSIAQNILTPGKAYVCEFVIDTSSAGKLKVYSGGTQVSPFGYDQPGQKKFYFVAGSAAFKIENSGATNITIDDVSVKEVGQYTGRLRRGVLVRIRATFENTTHTLFQGVISNVMPMAGAQRERQVTVVAEDATLKLLDAEFAPTLKTNVTPDAAIAEIFDEAAIPYPYPHRYWLLGVEGYSNLDESTTLWQNSATSFEIGKTTLSYTGDADSGKGIAAQGFIRDILGAEMGGRFYFDVRNNRYVFHNRHHDILNITVAATFKESDFENVDYAYGQDLVNQVALSYAPREVGASGSVLWTHTGVPFQVRANETRKFNVRYRDPGEKAARVGASATIVPFPGTDIIANTASDGSGTSKSSAIGISFEGKATSAILTLIGTSVDVYITTLQLRGTPLLVYNQAFAEALDGQSIADYGIAKVPIDLPALDDEDDALAYANFYVGQFKTPISRFRSVTFTASDLDSALMTQALARSVADRITITEAWSGHSKDYIIVGVNQQALIPAGITTTWILKPAARAEGWLLETVGRSELDETTLLAF